MAAGLCRLRRWKPPDRLGCIGRTWEARDTMKARLYFDVEFNGRRTDSEGIAAALDKVVETGMSALGDCWEKYGGQPKVGQLLVLDTAQAAGKK